MIKEAIKAFEEVIGAEYTHTDSMSMEKYHSSCIPVSRVIAAVLQPDSAKDVQQIVKIAAKFNVGLYPISTGNNWGYGSANPVRDNNIIVDLSRMNRIIEVNQKLAYTVIEPGVTQQQLYEYLMDNLRIDTAALTDLNAEYLSEIARRYRSRKIKLLSDLVHHIIKRDL